jgi:hypothetical protein
MGRIRVDIEIDASVDDVWRAVEPIERHVDWMVDAVAIRFVGPQTRGVGTEFLCDTRVGPITLVDRMEVVEWEPPRRMGVKHTGIVTGIGVFELEPIDLDRRTRFTWIEELRFPWYFGARLGEVVGGRAVMKQIWRRNLRRLKQLVEASNPPTS